ncbi:MAG: hypothetical protein IT236_09460 [Bacteroidia bacterium]|nr:hypothetical protein [Bacteroidia bacterium]
MKHAGKILILLVLIFGPVVLLAQNDKEKIEALRVAFINKKLELSTSESEKFWPVYNEYNEKLRAVKKNLRQSYKRKPDIISDADAEELFKLEAQTKQAELDLYKQYSERLKQIVGVKKMVILHLAEEEFRQKVLEIVKGKSD